MLNLPVSLLLLQVSPVRGVLRTLLQSADPRAIQLLLGVVPRDLEVMKTIAFVLF